MGMKGLALQLSIYSYFFWQDASAACLVSHGDMVAISGHAISRDLISCTIDTASGWLITPRLPI